MKIFEKAELDHFLELQLVASSFLKTNKEYACIHDDNDGYTDQCLKIALKKDSSRNEVFHIKTPTNHGLRFRNYAGGGSSPQVHNALKVLVYASRNMEQFLPGLERETPSKKVILRNINDILDGVIILPPEIFADKKCLPNYFFGIVPHFRIAIAVDGDTHIITEFVIEPEKQIRSETSIWNPEPFIFSTPTSFYRTLHNALILLAIATKQSGHLVQTPR